MIADGCNANSISSINISRTSSDFAGRTMTTFNICNKLINIFSPALIQNWLTIPLVPSMKYGIPLNALSCANVLFLMRLRFV